MLMDRDHCDAIPFLFLMGIVSGCERGAPALESRHAISGSIGSPASLERRMRLNIRSLLALAAVLHLGVAAAQAPHTHEHSFGNAEKWSKVFDDPKRDAWQKPHEVIQALK